jgi:hypothetical protein
MICGAISSKPSAYPPTGPEIATGARWRCFLVNHVTASQRHAAGGGSAPTRSWMSNGRLTVACSPAGP